MNPSVHTPPWAAHGGTDAQGVAPHDFSSNANPLPWPEALRQALASADRRHYPAPGYEALCEALAAQQGVSARRIVPTAGSSEAIRRLTLMAHLQGVRTVWVPQPGYGDYTEAARALGLRVLPCPLGEGAAAVHAGEPVLWWLCDPLNPTGRLLSAERVALLAAHLPELPQGSVVALDLAYEPLRMAPRDDAAWAPVWPQVWQLWSPNKALGATGVRAGWLVAPAGLQADSLVQRLWQLAPGWVLSAEGVALLQACLLPEVQAWLAQSRAQLRLWRDDLQGLLKAQGWRLAPTDSHFFLARPPEGLRVDAVAWRAQGLKLRDATSLGAPGWWRLSAQGPQAQQALARALSPVSAQAPVQTPSPDMHDALRTACSAPATTESGDLP